MGDLETICGKCNGLGIQLPKFVQYWVDHHIEHMVVEAEQNGMTKDQLWTTMKIVLANQKLGLSELEEDWITRSLFEITLNLEKQFGDETVATFWALMDAEVQRRAPSPAEIKSDDTASSPAG